MSWLIRTSLELRLLVMILAVSAGSRWQFAIAIRYHWMSFLNLLRPWLKYKRKHLGSRLKMSRV